MTRAGGNGSVAAGARGAGIAAGTGWGTARPGVVGHTGDGRRGSGPGPGRPGGSGRRTAPGNGGAARVVSGAGSALRGGRDRVPGDTGAEGTVALGSGGLLPPSLLLSHPALSQATCPPAPSHRPQPSGPSPAPCQGPGLVPSRPRNRDQSPQGQVPPALSAGTQRCTTSGSHTHRAACSGAPCKATLFCHRSHCPSSPLPSRSVSSTARPWLGHGHGLMALA